ncbi:MAG: hypothetical protein LQ338_004390 [Usnochroma carphineum]|nr:MAG: hypothetical protein LQ338_004390 [Usnochroma carphineum]
MDLVAGVRKEGSRQVFLFQPSYCVPLADLSSGGRDAFKWEDVKDDQHRENYLGHSLMAPVGRWQKNKDLSWYAKGDTSQAAADAATARAEEIRRIKEAEQDALSEALGFPVQPRIRDNQLAAQKEVEKALKETAEGDEEGGKGVGFGSYMGANVEHKDSEEVMGGYIGDLGGLEGGHSKAEKREHRRRRTETATATGDIADITTRGSAETRIAESTGGTDPDPEMTTDAGGDSSEEGQKVYSKML